MILADEVGLGKTIEAGLIIKELRARQLINRVLIVVPASLQLQWQSELRSKFNEDFEVLDGAALKFLGRRGTNPWMVRDNVICSLPFAASPKRAEQIIEADWDLVIFDEAHRVRRSYQSARKTTTTQAYRMADELKELVNGLLLLTATPMQLHPFELYSLIELVEPGLLPTFSAYESLRRRLPQLNALMKSLKGWNALGRADQEAAVEENADLLDELGIPAGEAVAFLGQDEEREGVMDVLIGKHPLAGALVRNRKAEVGGFTSREANTVPVTLEPDELELYEDVTTYIRDGYNRARADKNTALGFVMVIYQKMLASSSHAIRQSFRRRIQKLRAQLTTATEVKHKSLGEGRLAELQDAAEATSALQELENAALDLDELRLEIQTLEGLVERLGQVRDSKAAELLVALDVVFGKRRDEKVVVFTQFIETQDFLAAALRQNGYTVSTFNGTMSLEEKEESVRRFRERDQVLISTEAGGEGRNFQFCHIMVNYDLPWNPMRVEQRIGRLDRIGQRRPVLIYNLYCEGTVEQRVLDILEVRIGLFVESVGSLDPILGEVERDIEKLVLSHVDRFNQEFQSFEASLEQRVRQARERERTLADFILDRASLRRDQAAELLDQSPLARWSDLERFTEACLAYFGGALRDHADGGKVVSMSPRLMGRLKQTQGTVRGTFDPELAREHEELPFLAFGHALVDRIAELPTSFDPVATTVRRASDVPPGEWVEVYYEMRGEGIRPRGQSVRFLAGADGEVRSEKITSLPASGTAIEDYELPAWRAGAVEATKVRFQQDFDAFRREVRTEDERSKAEAIARADRIYKYRRVRLVNLVEEQAAWIAEKEASGSERERRVLPARRGLLAKNKERLAGLEVEYEAEIDAIRSREPGAAATVLAAGMVLGG